MPLSVGGLALTLNLHPKIYQPKLGGKLNGRPISGGVPLAGLTAEVFAFVFAQSATDLRREEGLG